ncbi:MAG: hypothetical protein JSU04_19950 [Bdellovibrionales bacterium]|nr:hypothetical protein [Bdellovibrionales bacterium]
MRLVLILSILLMSVFASAGDKIGNGGGLWACYNAKGELLHGMLVDLYEAKAEFQLTTIQDSSLDVVQIIYNRGNIVSGLKKGRQLLQTMDEVLRNDKYVNVELSLVNDAFYRIIPPASSCAEGKWKYTQFANYTTFGTVLVREDLWHSYKIPVVDKAALFWHEAIYRWLRLEQGDLDSIRTRQAVGILFSDLPVAEMQKRLDAVLDLQHPPIPPGTFHGN